MGFYDYKPKSSPINWKWGLDRLAKGKVDFGWWRNVSDNFNLTQEQVRRYAEYLNWHHLSQNRRFPFDDNFLTEFEDKIRWEEYVCCHRISESTYLRFKKHISVCLFLLNTNENKMKMVRKYFNQLSDIRPTYQYMNSSFYPSQRDQILDAIALPEKFLEENLKDDREWEIISYRQKLSKEFIEKHKDKIKFENLMMNYKMKKLYAEWFPKEYEKWCDRKAN